MDYSVGGSKTGYSSTRNFESTVSSRNYHAPFAKGKKGEVEKLWGKFFSNPSEWQDHRFGKGHPRFPDFKHKSGLEALWLNSKWVPPWVEAKLATISPGVIKPSSFLWNQKLSKYAQAGQYKKTLKLFHQMQREGISASRATFFPVLNACASLGLLEDGQRIHKHIIQGGFEADLFVSSSLIDMYAKCGSIDDAQKVFNNISRKDVVAWNAMIMGYMKCGQGWQALQLSQQMRHEGVDPDPVTLMAVLNACASVGALEDGKHAHEEVIQRGYESNLFVGSSLVDMYAKCGSIEDAEKVFNQMPTRDVVAWTAMILGYVQHNKGEQALELFENMKLERVDPNSVTFVAVLNACGSLAAIEDGRHVHEEIIHRGFELDVVIGSSVVDMYVRCGNMEDAWRVFRKLPARNVKAWAAMIMGYVKCGEGQKALELSQQIQQEIDPDPVIFVAVLNACASVSALEKGRYAHKEIIQKGYDSDVFVGSSLIDMYAKCGSIEDAEKVFNQMPTRNMVAWTALLSGYGRHGYTKEAIEHFKSMCKAVEVDGVTFISLLSACSHGGLVDEGLEYFKSMSAVYNISPKVEHYSCVVDLLGRAGRLREAEDLIRSMPFEQNATMWLSLLSACRVHGEIDVGERVANEILKLEPGNGAASLLLSKICYPTPDNCDSNEIVN